MPCDWPVDPAATARSLVTVQGDAKLEGAAGLLAAAAWIVDGMHYLHDLDGHLAVDPTASVLGYDTATVDLAHARWATTDAIAALDLCAAVLGRILTEEFPRNDGRELDLSHAARNLTLRRHEGANAWLDDVTRDPYYMTACELRSAGIRRVVRRNVGVAVGAGTVRSAGSNDNYELQVDVDELLAEIRDFATRHVQSFVARTAAGRFGVVG